MGSRLKIELEFCNVSISNSKFRIPSSGGLSTYSGHSRTTSQEIREKYFRKAFDSLKITLFSPIWSQNEFGVKNAFYVQLAQTSLSWFIVCNVEHGLSSNSKQWTKISQDLKYFQSDPVHCMEFYPLKLWHVKYTILTESILFWNWKYTIFWLKVNDLWNTICDMIVYS